MFVRAYIERCARLRHVCHFAVDYMFTLIHPLLLICDSIESAIRVDYGTTMGADYTCGVTNMNVYTLKYVSLIPTWCLSFDRLQTAT